MRGYFLSYGTRLVFVLFYILNKIFKNTVQGGNKNKSYKSRCSTAAHNSTSHRGSKLGTGADSEGDGKHCEYCSKSCHNDWSQPGFTALNDGVFQRHLLFWKKVDIINQYNCIIYNNTHKQYSS